MLVIAIVAAISISAAFFPALTLNRRARIGILLGLCVPVLLAPCLVPAEARLARFLAAVLAFLLVAKLYDLHLGASRGERPDLANFVRFLANPCALVLRRLGDERFRSRREDLRRLLLASLGLTAGSALLFGVFRVGWESYPFALEHCVKVLSVFAAILPGTAIVPAAWRLLGGTGREFMNAPFLARTPADFWRRYNRPVQQFFHEDIFKPIGGLRAPIRSTLLIFAVSACVHEYVFGMAIGRVQGYQTLFFMLQGCAVASTLAIKPKGWRAAGWIAATLAFNLASAVLFFASVNGLLPFYANDLPAGLKGR